MPFEIESTRFFNYPVDQVYESAVYCVTYMGGKVLKKEPENEILHAQMDKKLFGDYLGDRSKLEVQFSKVAPDKTKVYIFAYPLNAVGQKLMFGARKGVVERMMEAFFKEIEKHLQKQEDN